MAHPSSQVDVLGVQKRIANCGDWAHFEAVPFLRPLLARKAVGTHLEEVTVSQFMVFQSVSGFGSRKDSITPETHYT